MSNNPAAIKPETAVPASVYLRIGHVRISIDTIARLFSIKNADPHDVALCADAARGTLAAAVVSDETPNGRDANVIVTHVRGEIGKECGENAILMSSAELDPRGHARTYLYAPREDNDIDSDFIVSLEHEEKPDLPTTVHVYGEPGRPTAVIAGDEDNPEYNNVIIMGTDGAYNRKRAEDEDLLGAPDPARIAEDLRALGKKIDRDARLLEKFI